MGFPQYRSTPRRIEDGYSPRREVLEKWGSAWTATIAEAAGGLDFHGRSEVYRIIHEIRRRVEAGDYGPPIAYPQPGPKAQAELKLEAGE